MRIVCPSCKATYEVPDALLGAAARKVRCARCSHEWTPEPAVAAAPPKPPEPQPPPRQEPRPERAPRPEPARPLPVPHVDIEPPPSLRPRPRPLPGVESIAALAISVVLLAACGWAGYVWRAELMQAWPPSQRLFAALGLH